MFDTILPRRWAIGLLTGMMLGAFCLTPLSGQNTNPANQKLSRPNAKPLVKQQVTPELQKVLELWYHYSRQVERLEGQHDHEEINDTFLVIKKTKGKFWFEAPDKGRIDLEPVKITQNKEARGKKSYEIKPGSAKRWVCDGKEILQIDDEEKTVEKISIPTEYQGADIMNGPLPFLFGLPPEEAKKRFALKLLGRTEKQIYISAKPITRRDAGNYDEAQIVLSAKNYLPTHIKLIHPGGTSSETFQFGKTKVNKPGIFEWISGDPFDPKLRGYKVVMNQPGPQPQQMAALPAQPSTQQPESVLNEKPLQVIGLNWKEAEKKIQQCSLVKKEGFKYGFAKGKPAPNTKAVYRIYDVQVNKAMKKIVMTAYLPMANKPPANNKN